jgi:hypothetical protein
LPRMPATNCFTEWSKKPTRNCKSTAELNCHISSFSIIEAKKAPNAYFTA